MEINRLTRVKPKKALGFFREKIANSIFLLLLFCFSMMLSGYAQTTKKITGKVIDSSGEPIIGANIGIAKAASGTIADVEGKFTLEVTTHAVLVVSFLGYETKQVSVGSSNYYEITLNESLQDLDEIVVVGYGTQRKATLTGAITAISAEQLTSTKNQNVQNMLTGKLPGVRVVQKTSEPGVFTNQFDIRGFDAPLIVVDGIPRDNFERMDPNDIESISILKDASAAVYGVHSANGVVLITTKKGQIGKPKLEYSMYYGLQIPADILRPEDAYSRAIMMNERTFRNTGQGNLNPTPTYDDEYLNDLLSGKTQSTDWYAAVLRTTAPQQQHNVSVKGGSERNTYYMNVGYMNQEGFFKSGDMVYERYNLRANADAKISDRLRVALNLSGIIDKRDRQQRDAWDIFSALWRSVPTSSIYANDNPNYYRRPDGGIYNAVAETYKKTAGYKLDQRRVFQSQGELNYDFPYIQGLAAKAVYSFDYSHDDNTTYLQKYNTYLYDEATSAYIPYSYGAENSIERRFGKSIRQMWNVSLSYQRSFLDSHNVNALFLYEESTQSNDNFRSKRFLRMQLPYLFVGEDSGQVAMADPNGITDYANKGLVGRLNYDYKGKYMLEGSFRYDGSSHFLPGKQWDFYYGLMGAWRISEERFIKNNLAFVNNLKVRATYGRVGYDNSNLYEFLDGYNYPATDGNRENGYPRGYYFGSAFVPTLSVRGTANTNITWYEIRTINLGLDADFWNGRLGFSVDLFQRTRDGLYARRDVQLPATFGSAMPQENLNGDLNKGFELELRHRNRVGGLSYGITGNITLTRRMNQTWVHTPYTNSYNNWRNNRENRYNDIWWGFDKGGRYQSYDEIYHFYLANGVNVLPGDYYYDDWNNDGIIDDMDLHPVATTTDADKSNLADKRNYPLMNFALSPSFEYGHFDFDFMIQGSAMSYVAYGSQLTSGLAWDGNVLEHLMDRWYPTDPKANPYNPATQWVAGEYGYGGNTPDERSRFRIQNGAYARLKTVTMGYTLPKKYLVKLGINNLRLYVNAYNLFTITGVKTLDPEKPMELDGAMYPLNKTINFGASVTF